MCSAPRRGRSKSGAAAAPIRSFGSACAQDAAKAGPASAGPAASARPNARHSRTSHSVPIAEINTTSRNEITLKTTRSWPVGNLIESSVLGQPSDHLAEDALSENDRAAYGCVRQRVQDGDAEECQPHALRQAGPASGPRSDRAPPRIAVHMMCRTVPNTARCASVPTMSEHAVLVHVVEEARSA